MKVKYLVVVLAGVLAGCVSVRDTRLDGEWISNRDATVAYNRKAFPNMNWAKYSQLFGHLRLNYDQHSVTVNFKGRTKSEPLRIVRKTKDSVTKKSWDELDKKDRLTTVHFVNENMYWILIRNTELREYFTRIR